MTQLVYKTCIEDQKQFKFQITQAQMGGTGGQDGEGENAVYGLGMSFIWKEASGQVKMAGG